MPDDIIIAEVILPLTEDEKQEHEERVTLILNSFRQIGERSLEIWKHLQWIKEKRTYREKYDNFQDFCKGELAKDNSQVYRWIKDAEFKEALLLEAASEEERGSILALKESNTRFIRTLPEESQIPFWKLVYSLLDTTKSNGTVEPTTAFLENAAARVNEILDTGGLHIGEEFVTVREMEAAAEEVGVSSEVAKQLLLQAGLTEDGYETLKRQAQHIREKSAKHDVISVKGFVDIQNGDIIITDRDNFKHNLAEIVSTFAGRQIQLSLKSPTRSFPNET